MLTVTVYEQGHQLTTSDLTPAQANRLVSTISEQLAREAAERPWEAIDTRVEVSGTASGEIVEPDEAEPAPLGIVDVVRESWRGLVAR